MNPEDLLELSKEKLVEKLEEFNIKNEEVMANLVMIREELLHRLTEEKKDGELVGDYSISKATRITFKTTVQEAEEFGAVVQEPKVDTKKLRKLYDSGAKVPGVEVSTYLSVRRLKQEELEK